MTAATRRQLRSVETGARSSVHGFATRGQIQSEKFHGHFCLPCRRSNRSVVVSIAALVRTWADWDFICCRPARRDLVRAQLMVGPQTNRIRPRATLRQHFANHRYRRAIIRVGGSSAPSFDAKACGEYRLNNIARRSGRFTNPAITAPMFPASPTRPGCSRIFSPVHRAWRCSNRYFRHDFGGRSRWPAWRLRRQELSWV